MLDRQDTAAILTLPLLKKLYPEFLELLRLSRSPKSLDPETVFGLQAKWILPRLEQIETALNRAKKEKDNTYPYKYLTRVYKWIMDGVALRLLGFNSNAYRILSDNRSPGSIIKAGRPSELKKLEGLVADGNIAILGDTTNFIRLADIAVFPLSSHVELLEVKSKSSKNSKNKPKATLQEIRMKKAEEMVNGNYCIINGDRCNVKVIPISAKTYLNVIKCAILRAKRDGIGYANIGSCLKVHVMDFHMSSKLGIDSKTVLDENLRPFPEEHDIISLNNLDLAYAGHDEFPRGVFPPTVLKLPTRLITDMLCGKVLVTIIFDLTNFVSLIESRGFEVEVDTTPTEINIGEMFNKRTMPLEKSHLSSKIIVKHKDGWYMELPETMLPRIWAEYLHPDSAIAMIEYLYTTRHQRIPGGYLHIFNNHTRLYR
jgi:hypothetical protein